MRGRGLKQNFIEAYEQKIEFAPHAGAWIETPQGKIISSSTTTFAPHAGAWIETVVHYTYRTLTTGSPLMRGRGLKQVLGVGQD